MTSENNEHSNGHANGSNGSANGHAELDEDVDGVEEGTDEGVEEELEPLTGEIAELASACVRFVHAKTGVALDFTRDTLSVLDLYVAEARGELSAKPESLDLLQATTGAYFGEVIRREHHGFWKTGPHHEGWRIQMARVFLEFNPIGMMREALLLDSAEGWNAHIEVDPAERDKVSARLKAMPEVEEDEFYAPTTRIEVIDVAVELLADSMRREGLGGTRFTKEDY